MLGIELTDSDVGNVPLLRTDQYGNFIPDANGFAQVITGIGADGIPNTADDVVVSGTLGARSVRRRSARIRTATPSSPTSPTTPFRSALADGDIEIGLGNPGNGSTPVRQRAAGRALHRRRRPRQREHRPDRRPPRVPRRAQPPRRAHQGRRPGRRGDDAGRRRHASEAWLPQRMARRRRADVPTGAAIDALAWDGERLFQAAKFGTEMQYQHLVFEEFARKIQPQHQRLPGAGRLRRHDRSDDRRRVRARGLPLRPLHADRDDRPLRPDLQRRRTSA